ncbi:uncharacterized protein LOC123306056 [Chrysoperla carnea]|uniref:uncharacterized protein LOC123306056 n=1 Tax=Chrysoperla carnea TaxID=189513 RepID=UPI001D094FE3|nr:uncharacterized protein LOC123306056 [Chrysoperla carnea]
MRRSQALPSFRRPLNDIDVREHNESHKRPPSPDSSISRIFYKSGPLNSKHHKMRVNPKVILKGAWITSEMSYVGDNNEQIVKCTLTELAIFLAYLIVLMIVFFTVHPENQYDLTHAMEKAFLETSFISNDIHLKYVDIIDAAAILDEGPDYANGKLAWYPRVGSLIDLPSSSGALADIIALQNSLWVARGVRTVILHYNLMNFTREEISMFFSKYNIKPNQKHISQKQIDEIETDLKIRKFIPLLPQDVERHLRTKEKHAIRAQKEKRFANSRYHVFTYAEYEVLQAQLDQIEILLELSTANLYELLKIFQSGVKYKWMVKEESDAQSECCNISPGGHANSDPTSSDST